MSETFLVLRTNDTSPQLFFHDGETIDATGIGSLPGAALEDLTAQGGVRTDVKHNNRVVTLLDMIFVIQDSKVYVSTDEAATFTLDFTFTGASANTWETQVVGPIPVMASNALHLIGFYVSGSDIFVFDYDVAGDSWSDTDTTINATTMTAGATVPVVFDGLVHVRIGDAFIGYDPVSTGTLSFTNSGLSNLGADQMLVWNGGLYLGPVTDGGINGGMALFQNGVWDLGIGGIDLSLGAVVSSSSKSGVFVDPATNNLIVMTRTSGGALVVNRVTTGAVVTDITGTVVGTALATLGGTGDNVRIWPHLTRAPGGTYSVEIYAAGAPGTADAVQRFTWVDDATAFTELGVVGGSGDMAFPYAIHGGDYNGFFPGERRVVQTAQVSIATGLTITCQAYYQTGGTVSVRAHYDKVGDLPNSLTLEAMTITNPLGDPGLSLVGSNPGARIDGVPANRTAITFDWDQVTDGFVTGDNFNFQLEIF